MSKIYVYADFDWLKEIEPIGILRHEMLRGSETYGFDMNYFAPRFEKGISSL